MADDSMNTAWDKAEKAITKGKGEAALKILREADADGKEPTTLRLAGQATWLEAKVGNNRATYRRAASLLRESTKKNPRDKKADRLYNDLLNEMQDKGISETSFPRLLNDGTPTPAGIVAIFLAGVLVLAMINVANRAGTTTDVVELDLTWNGGANSGTVTIELYPGDAPMHVENFKLLVENGDYDGTIFHRIIDDFMIQGGDFTNSDGTGGHAAKFFGYCNGQEQATDCASETAYTVPDEADNGLVHEVCTISMAKTSAPHTGGSQFFLIPSDSNNGKGPDWLDGVHTVFGKITSGCEHVDAISHVETGEQDDKPTQAVTLVSASFVGSETTPWYQFW